MQVWLLAMRNFAILILTIKKQYTEVCVRIVDYDDEIVRETRYEVYTLYTLNQT